MALPTDNHFRTIGPASKPLSPEVPAKDDFPKENDPPPRMRVRKPRDLPQPGPVFQAKCSDQRQSTITREKLNFDYFVFGLLLRSNMLLPGLVPEITVNAEPDISLNLGNSPCLDRWGQSVQEVPKYESSYRNESGQPVLRIWQLLPGDDLHLAYCDGTEFWLDSAGQSVWANWPEKSSLENTASYLLGPVLGVLLRLRGVICLHASAVNLRDRCIVFLGSEGAGKSTTAAAFVQRGRAALSDDIVALDESGTGFQVLPAYPYLSLWPDSVKTLYGSSEALPRFAPDWEKRRLALGGHETRFENRALWLAAIYLLGDRCAESSPVIRAVSHREALLALVVHSYATNILDGTMRAREFAGLGRLVSSVPVRRIIPHQDPALIGKLCQVVADDFDKLILARSSFSS